MIVGSPSFCTPTLHFRPAKSVHCAATHRRSLLTLLRSFAQERRPSPSLSMPCALFMCLRGCHQERSFNSSTLNSSTSASVSPLDATLTADLRVGFQGLYLQILSRQRPRSAEIVRLQLSKCNTYNIRVCNPFRRNTYKKPGGARDGRCSAD